TGYDPSKIEGRQPWECRAFSSKRPAVESASNQFQHLSKTITTNATPNFGQSPNVTRGSVRGVVRECGRCVGVAWRVLRTDWRYGHGPISLLSRLAIRR